MGLRCPSGLSEHGHEWKSTKPQKVLVFTAVDLLKWRLSPSFRDEFCLLEGAAVGLCNMGHGGEFRVSVDRISDVTQDSTDMRSKSYQLPSLSQIRPRFSTRRLHPALLRYIEPICKCSLLKGSPPKADIHPQREKTWFTSFNQCFLLLSMGSEDSETEKFGLGKVAWIFPLLCKSPELAPEDC